MKISSIEFFKIDMPLAIPYTIAYETISKTTNVILKINTTTGLTGWGCAAPDMNVTGDTADDVIQNINLVVIDLLKGQSPFQIAKFNHILKNKIPGARSTKAMVDMALFDLMAKHAQLPLYKLLGGYRHSIPTSITIGIVSIEDTLKQAQAFLKDNFTIIKLKGGIDLNQDVEKIIKLREQFGTKFKLRFDANQGYTPDQTIEFIKLTKSSKIELLEQPTSPENESLLDHKIHHQIDIPVMADESIHNLKDAFKLAKNDMIDMVNIKLMKVGGILESQRINAVAKAAGMEVMVGCIDECALGISAGLHFSLSAPNVEFADLDGHLDLINDPFKDLFTLKNGILYPSQEAGLGKINL